MAQITADYVVRNYQPADEEQVLELLRKSLGESTILQRTSSLWQWKHSINPFGPSYIRIACGEDGEVIGMRAFLRWEFEEGDRVVKAVRAVDTATHPGYRRMGIFSALTKQVIEDVRNDGVELIFNTPNEDVLPGYLKLGWEKVAKVHPLVKVLNYPAFAAGLVRSRFGKQSSRRHQPAEFFREGAPPVASLLSRRPALEELIEQDGKLWGDQGRIRTHRSWNYLNWRFGGHPTIPYWSLFVEREGDIRACVIFRTNTRYGMKEVVLCELLMAEPDRDLASTLLEDLNSRISADYMVSFFPQGLVHRKFLERSGFRAAPKLGIDFTVKPLDGYLRLDPLQFGSWGLTVGDLEFF